MNNFEKLLEQLARTAIKDDDDIRKEADIEDDSRKEDDIELDSDLRYTDHYQYRGVEYIKTKNHIILDDPLIDKVLELDALNIKTPLEEWIEKFGEVVKRN
jgi:hypothetical protein